MDQELSNEIRSFCVKVVEDAIDNLIKDRKTPLKVVMDMDMPLTALNATVVQYASQVQKIVEPVIHSVIAAKTTAGVPPFAVVKMFVLATATTSMMPYGNATRNSTACVGQ